LCGGLLLLLLLKDWSRRIHRFLYVLFLISGIFLFLYGFVNFTTFVLSSLGLLHLQVDGFALRWRMFFWEPFWMLGGVCFIFSALFFKKDTQSVT
ncbi:MAG TPA: hypothetical protein VFK27_01270, partial [Bacillales bacterium]|nr:hypothetical protein [Bacillales bacterium]